MSDLLTQALKQNRRLRPATVQSYGAAVGSFVGFAGADPSRWNGRAIEAWIERMRADELAPRTINSRIAALRATARFWAWLEGRPDLDFARLAQPVPAPKRSTRRALTLDEARALVAACDSRTPHGLRDRALIVTGLRTGCRREGLHRLTVEDFNGRRMRVILKGGQPYIVVIDDEVRREVDAWTTWLARHGVADALFRRIRPTINDYPEIGGRLHLLAINDIVRERADQAGIRHVHPHLFRHTAITWLLDRGVPKERISRLTGHHYERSPDILDLYDSGIDENDPVGAVLPSLVTP